MYLQISYQYYLNSDDTTCSLSLLLTENYQHFSASQLPSYKILLLAPSVNLTTLIPEPSERKFLDCVSVAQKELMSRTDLLNMPLNVDLLYFCCESYLIILAIISSVSDIESNSLLETRFV